MRIWAEIQIVSLQKTFNLYCINTQIFNHALFDLQMLRLKSKLNQKSIVLHYDPGCWPALCAVQINNYTQNVYIYISNWYHGPCCDRSVGGNCGNMTRLNGIVRYRTKYHSTHCTGACPKMVPDFNGNKVLQLRPFLQSYLTSLCGAAALSPTGWAELETWAVRLLRSAARRSSGRTARSGARWGAASQSSLSLSYSFLLSTKDFLQNFLLGG